MGSPSRPRPEVRGIGARLYRGTLREVAHVYTFRDGLVNVFGVWPDLTTQLVEVRDLGDLTVAGVHFRGQGAGSDIPWDETFWQVVRWRRGKCVWLRSFESRTEALEAVGLTEQDAPTHGGARELM